MSARICHPNYRAQMSLCCSHIWHRAADRFQFSSVFAGVARLLALLALLASVTRVTWPDPSRDHPRQSPRPSLSEGSYIVWVVETGSIHFHVPA
jgi:hypothetical protein